MNIDLLPKFITCSYGLPDKLNELQRDLPIRAKSGGLSLRYDSGVGVVFNRRDNTIYGHYKQVATTKKQLKYKLVIK